MKILVAIFLLALICKSQILTVSGKGTLISLGQTTISTYPYGVSFPVSTAKWIWNQNWQNAPPGETITAFSNFKVLCACSKIRLYISGDNSFKAYVNGKFVVQGNSWGIVYQAQLTQQVLNVGENTLEVVGQNISGPAGIIFAIKVE